MRCEVALLEPAVLIQLFHARRHSLQLPPALRAVQSLAKTIRPPQHAIADILFDPIPPSVSTESNALILGTGPLRSYNRTQAARRTLHQLLGLCIGNRCPRFLQHIKQLVLGL